MKTVWLTQPQLDQAWHELFEVPYQQTEAVVMIGFSGISGPVPALTWPEVVLRRKYKLLPLFFRRRKNQAGWQLITPVQVVDEWLARQMQSVDEGV